MLGTDRTVSKRVTNVVVTLGWLWVFSLLFALPIGVYVAIYNAWKTGTVPNVGAYASAINPGFVVLGAAIALGGLVLLLSNATFGSEVVDATIDQGQELKEDADQSATDTLDEATED
jgi:ABC-type dipeptide/oligopeptide/nickel transport system permease component